MKPEKKFTHYLQLMDAYETHYAGIASPEVLRAKFEQLYKLLYETHGPNSEAIFNRSKFSKIMSYEGYLKLWHWHTFVKNRTLIETKPHCVTPLNMYMCKGREWASKTLEKIIRQYAMSRDWEQRKPFDKGMKIRSKGKEMYVKTGYGKKGKADVVLTVPVCGLSLIVNLEVKVGHDRQKPEQIQEQERAAQTGQWYRIVKVLDDFWAVVDAIDSYLERVQIK